MSGGAHLLIEQAPGQTRALHLVGDRVIEAWHDFDHDPDRTGSVHAVRVDRVFAAQNRAIATLANGEAVSIRTTRHDSLTPGAIAIITIVAARRETKPWQAVTGARLASQNLVLLPGETGVARSGQMTDPPSEAALAALDDCLAATPGFGVILRRHAGRAEDNDLAGQAGALMTAWQKGQTGLAGTGAPGCLFDPGGVAGRVALETPHLQATAIGPDGAEDFASRWDEMILDATRSGVPLAGGGVMWIEPTRALTAIDLDSGSGDLGALFTAAPDTIANHLRLRQVGGLIAVDLPRGSAAVMRRFDAALEAALARDPRHPDRLGRTRGGVIEIRIPHGRPGPGDWAADSVAVGALSALRSVSLRPQLAVPRIECPPLMADWLRGPGTAAMAALDRPVELVVSSEAKTATLIETRV